MHTYVIYVIWLDSDIAKIFKIQAEASVPHVMHRHETDHHTSRDPEKHRHLEKFHHEIAAYLHDADEILVMGPGFAKDHFKTNLGTHHNGALAKKIVGLETTDRLTDPQILAASREFFKKHSGAYAIGPAT